MIEKRDLLLAEDDGDIREMIEICLGKLNLSFVSVGNGSEAITVLKKFDFDILLTDFMMPEVDGIELVEWCRAQKKHFPVIFLTANAELVKREKIALEDCCASLLRKSVNLEVLETVIIAAKKRIHHLHCIHTR